MQVVLGKDKYEELTSKTIDGRPVDAADVWDVWNGNRSELLERRDADPKSDAGPSVLEDAPASDRE